MNKKIVLRKWIEYLLIIINIICVCLIAGDCDSMLLFILKGVISIIVIFFNSIILDTYGRL